MASSWALEDLSLLRVSRDPRCSLRPPVKARVAGQWGVDAMRQGVLRGRRGLEAHRPRTISVGVKGFEPLASSVSENIGENR